MKKTALILVFVLICGMFLPAAAQTTPTSGVCGEGVTWSYKDGTLTISGKGSTDGYSIPENSEKYGTLVAPWNSFAKEITDIVIEDGVTGIGSYAFTGISKVTTIDIPDSVTGIGMYAFCGCTSLETINIGKGVEGMGAPVDHGPALLFWGWYDYEACTSLKAINVDPGNEYYKSVDGVLFNVFDDGSFSLVVYPKGKQDKTYIIPEGTKWIENYAFRGNPYLESVTIPDSVYIAYSYPFTSVSIFEDCTALKNVAFPKENKRIHDITNDLFKGTAIERIAIPEGVETIEWSAFEDCTRLTAIALPTSLHSLNTVIDMDAFKNCISLTDIYYAGTEEQWKQVTVANAGNDAFKKATVHFESGLPAAPVPQYRESGNVSWAFTGTTLRIKGSGDMTDYSTREMWHDFSAPWLFENNNKILFVEMESGVTSIGTGAFIGCNNMISVNIPSTVTKIGDYAFSGCKAIADVYYSGTEAQWNAIAVSAYGNDALKNAAIHFESRASGDGESAAPEKPAFPEEPTDTKKPISFTDVTDKSVWYYDTVYAAAEAGIIAGNNDGTFAPDGKLTWAQTVTFATRLMQFRNGEKIYGEADQQGIYWYQVYVDYALEHGIIDAASYEPNEPITRAAAAVMFARVLGETAEAVNEVPEGYFSDVPAGEAADSIYTLAAAGIVNGKLDTATNTVTFGYEDTFRRSEVATIVARMAGLVELARIG